jgi:hypothetical protein
MLHSSILAMMRNLGLAAGLTCMAVASPIAAQSSNPNELRAAIVFNVLRFIEFPASGDGTIEFCIAPGAPETAALRSFSGRRAGSRLVSVRSLRSSSYAGCDVVFLASSDRSEIERASARGRLLIGNDRNFIDNGGTVGLVQSGGQVRFQLNLRAASANQLTISSRLIRLASRVTR